MSQPDELVAALETLADLVADRVASRLLTAQQEGWVDQAGSPLGPRRHRAAVKRRVAAGQAGAAVIGRRHLLSKECLAEELVSMSKGKREPNGSLEDDIRAELRLVRGSP